MLFLIKRTVSIIPQSVEKSQAEEARASEKATVEGERIVAQHLQLRHAENYKTYKP